jgi:hypothetical protein
MGYNITSLGQIIDIAAIRIKISVLRNHVEKFYQAAEKVEQASQICTPEAYTYNGVVVGEQIGLLADEMFEQHQQFVNYIDNLEEAANYVYDTQYAEYTAYQEELRRQENERRMAEEAARNGVVVH